MTEPLADLGSGRYLLPGVRDTSFGEAGRLSGCGHSEGIFEAKNTDSPRLTIGWVVLGASSPVREGSTGQVGIDPQDGARQHQTRSKEKARSSTVQGSSGSLAKPGGRS